MRPVHAAHASSHRASRGVSGPVVTDAHHRRLVNDVRKVLTDDLRKSEYRENPNPMAGHCYVASEALYHLLGGKAEGWKPMSIQHEGGPHWFLKHEDGAVIDATADQFRTPVPYDEGRGCGFLTRDPSARTKIVLRRVEHEAAG